MNLGGRVRAASEILEDMEKRKRPAANTLRDWGLSHRFAGSGDRAAIGNIVYDTLRKKSSQATFADSDEPVLNVFATLIRQWGYSSEELMKALSDDKFAPQYPDQKQIGLICRDNISGAPPHILADIQSWCVNGFQSNFSNEWMDEAIAFSERPPLDIRVNTLKSDRDKVFVRLSHTKVEIAKLARQGLRISSGTRNFRLPNVQVESGYQRGWFEIQDEGSQVVSELVCAQPGEKIMDYCAGGGGKTLALAAAMQNRGQIHAYDHDKNRLAPIYERLKRAGTRNVQIHDSSTVLEPLLAKMDRVIVDAPCTGSGVWRRRPDAKWHLTRENMKNRLYEQKEALSQAARFTRTGGVLIYITCSIFPEENQNQVHSFINRNPDFEIVSTRESWQELFGIESPQPWSPDMKSVTLTPASTQTDGFYFAMMRRKSGPYREFQECMLA